MTIPGEPTGNHPIVSWLSRLRSAVLARTVIAGKGIAVDHKTNGVVVSIKEDGGPVLPRKKIKVCYTLADGTEVAKYLWIHAGELTDDPTGYIPFEES